MLMCVLDETLYIATSNRTTSTIDLWSINKSDAYEFFNKHKDPSKGLTLNHMRPI